MIVHLTDVGDPAPEKVCPHCGCSPLREVASDAATARAMAGPEIPLNEDGMPIMPTSELRPGKDYELRGNEIVAAGKPLRGKGRYKLEARIAELEKALRDGIKYCLGCPECESIALEYRKVLAHD